MGQESGGNVVEMESEGVKTTRVSSLKLCGVCRTYFARVKTPRHAFIVNGDGDDRRSTIIPPFKTVQSSVQKAVREYTKDGMLSIRYRYGFEIHAFECMGPICRWSPSFAMYVQTRAQGSFTGIRF